MMEAIAPSIELPNPGVLALRTSCLDAARGHLGRVLVPHRLDQPRSEEKLDFTHWQAEFGGLALHRVRYGAPITLNVRHPFDFYMIQLVLQGCSAGEYGGTTVVARPGEFMVVNPGCVLSKRWEPGTDLLILCVSQPKMHAALGEASGARPGAPLHFAAQATPVADAAALVGLLGVACTDLAGPGLLTQPVVGRRLAETLLQVVLHALPLHRPPTTARNASPAAPRAVRRAEAFIDAHAANDITLADIAAAAGVSPRALHTAFRRFRDTTPMAQLRETRLTRARQLLAAGAGASVTEIAIDCGVRHLGRFAQDYADRFGEAPSATLRRGRVG